MEEAIAPLAITAVEVMARRVVTAAVVTVPLAITVVEVAALPAVMAAEAVRTATVEEAGLMAEEVIAAVVATRAVVEVGRTAAEVGAARTAVEVAAIRIANPPCSRKSKTQSSSSKLKARPEVPGGLFNLYATSPWGFLSFVSSETIRDGPASESGRYKSE